MKKKLLSLILAVLMLVSVLPVTAMAAKGDVTYTKVDSFTDGREYVLVIKDRGSYYAVAWRADMDSVTILEPVSSNVSSNTITAAIEGYFPHCVPSAIDDAGHAALHCSGRHPLW